MKAPLPDLPLTHPFYEWKKQMLEDVYRGGSEPPCPFCGLPRVSRSDYIRCSRCALNWINGEDLAHDPRIERFRKFMADSAATATKKPEKKD